MFTEQVCVECELHEDVHFSRLLADHQLAEVGRGELVEAEEAQVGEDLVQDVVVAIDARSVALEENLCEDLFKTRHVSNSKPYFRPS